MSSRDNVLINTDNRMFVIQDMIDQDSISKINYWLLQILEQDKKDENSQKNFERQPIKFYINSYGGFVEDAFSLIAIMLKSKSPIHTYCTSYADSCGLSIFLAGSKRFATDNVRMIYHQMSGGLRGKYQDICESKEMYDESNKRHEKYMLERTKFTQEEIDNIREKKLDYNMYIDELLEKEIVTDLIEEF